MPSATMVKPKTETVGRFEKLTFPDRSLDPVYFDADKHRYYGEIKENKRSEGGWSYVQNSNLVGVSTVSKALDGTVDPLLHWAAKLDQIGIAALVDEQIAADCSIEDLAWLCRQESIVAALRDAGMTWDKVRDQAAQRGTNIHERIFLALSQGKRVPSLSSLTPEERGYGQAALRWWRDVNPKPLHAEFVTCHHTQHYAGRPDLLCEIDGERVLVDAKTREKGRPRRSDHVQLPGYDAANEMCGYGVSERQIVLLLLPDGTYNAVLCEGTHEDFMVALDAYRHGADLEKRMRAGEKRAKEAS